MLGLLYRRAMMWLASVMLVVGCDHTEPITPAFLDELRVLEPSRFVCCENPEKFYPVPLIRRLQRAIGKFGDDLDTAEARYAGVAKPKGALIGNTAAAATIAGMLKPFDLVMTANKHDISGKTIPGRFSHVLIYLGTEQQLRAAGLWSLPAMVPHHAEIRAGNILAEAVPPRVTTSPASRLTEADAVAILRPELSSEARRAAIRLAYANIGKPYDFDFNVGDTNKLDCTDYVHLVMPSLALATHMAYGVPVILPDELPAQAIRGERMKVVSYIVGTPGVGAGFQERNLRSLMGDIAAYWGLPAD